jgi:hypothetical protein
MRINVNPSCNVLIGEHTKSIYAKGETTRGPTVETRTSTFQPRT